METKLIAFHLPQFHTFAENELWWGKGFTEWTNTKKAKPITSKHQQPKEPLNDNYYNMLDKNTRKWQSQLADQYGIYGFCYYHYWFNGKLLMEKPLELLLENQDINTPYCLCWANEPWSRAWDGGDKEIIMPQCYGDKHDWENHFQYLFQFFSDTRYIKICGKPVIVLYRTEHIEKCDEMINYWNKRAINFGMKGIYIIEEHNGFQKNSACENSDAILNFEPMYTLTYKRSNILRVLDKARSDLINYKYHSSNYWRNYNTVWRNIIKHSSNISDNEKKIFLGAFVDFDNTARKAKNSLIMLNATPNKFEKYLTKQIRNAKKNNSEFIFINAWNEWAEGAYLEPDKLNKYEYLEAVKKALNNFPDE